MPKKLNLTERTLSVHVIVESVRYLLNRHQLIRLCVQQWTSKTTSRKKPFNLDFLIFKKSLKLNTRFEIHNSSTTKTIHKNLAQKTNPQEYEKKIKIKITKR